jgi:serine/threonine-protein kinase RsbW
VAQRRRLTRSARLDSLADFRAFIASVCAAEDLPEPTSLALQMAVDEACANIILHGYGNRDPGSIIISMNVVADRAVIEITDFGDAFEPFETAENNIEAGIAPYPEAGFGLNVIYDVCDEVDYEASDEGNRLTLVKLLPRD